MRARALARVLPPLEVGLVRVTAEAAAAQAALEELQPPPARTKGRFQSPSWKNRSRVQTTRTGQCGFFHNTLDSPSRLVHPSTTTLNHSQLPNRETLAATTGPRARPAPRRAPIPDDRYAICISVSPRNSSRFSSPIRLRSRVPKDSHRSRGSPEHSRSSPTRHRLETNLKHQPEF